MLKAMQVSMIETRAGRGPQSFFVIIVAVVDFTLGSEAEEEFGWDAVEERSTCSHEEDCLSQVDIIIFKNNNNKPCNIYLFLTCK